MPILVRGTKPLCINSHCLGEQSAGTLKLLHTADIQAQLKSIVRLQGEGSRKSSDEVEYI